MGIKKADERGWALVSVLWVVFFLAIMAAAVQALMVTSMRGESRAFERVKANAAYDAAIVQAVLGISDPRVDKRWRVDGVPRQISFDGLEMQIAVQAELGRFDLNVIDSSMLHQLLQAQGLDDHDADIMTDRILDWRGKTGLVRLHGATDADYAAASLPYRQRHGPFQSVAELQMVLGMTHELFERIQPALTVYTHRPMIEPSVGTKEALSALYFNNAAESGSTQTDQGTATRGILDPTLPLAGQAFSITVRSLDAEHEPDRTVVIVLTGDPTRPYLTLAWN